MAETSGSWGMVLVFVAVLLCAAAFIGGMRFQQRRSGNQPGPQLDDGAGRLEVLESTRVADGRRLVLVRCDEVEHLVLLGGQSDLLIDGDVGKSRSSSTERSAAVAEVRATPKVPGGQLAPPVPTAAALAAPPAASLVQSKGKGAASNGASQGAASEATESAAVPPIHPAPPVRPDLGSLAELTNGERTDSRAPERVAEVDPVPSSQPRPAARRAFFGSAFGGRNRGSANGPQDNAAEVPEPEIAAAGASDAPAAGLVQGSGPRRAEVARATLAAVRSTELEGGAGKGQPAQVIRAPAAPAPTERQATSGPAVPAQGVRSGEAAPTRAAQRSEAPLVARAPQAPWPTGGRNSDAQTHGAPGSRLPAAPIEPGPAGRHTGPAGSPNGAKGNGLPTAGTPWETGNGLEDEIERALRSEPRVPLSLDIPATPSKQPNVPGNANDPGTTLGDLAARLESALAREIVAAQTTQQPAGGLSQEGVEASQVTIDEFAFEPEPAGGKPQEPELRPDASAVTQGPPATVPGPLSPAPAAEAEPKRERQEQAPVINLDSRRREPIDPLEDEMARLLGELTGDTNRR